MGKIKNTGYETMVLMPHSDYSVKIVDLIRSNLTPKLIKKELSTYHENDIALALDLLSREERNKLYNILDLEDLADVLEYSEHIAAYVQELNIRKQVEVLSEMDAAEVVEVLRELEKKERDSLLDLMEPDVRREIGLLNSFDGDEIGSIMSTNYIEIPDSATIKGAMSSLIEQAAEHDNISTLYVVDERKTFCGAVNLKDLIIAREGVPLEELMTCSYPYVYADALIDEWLSRLTNYSEDSIPVLDRENKLIGVITAQDLTEAVEEELSEDYAKLAGLTAEEDLAEPICLSVKKRLPWLVVLFALGFGVSSVIGLFEALVAQLPVIMCFQSLILDMSGNVGTQSLAVAIRVLMDKQIDRKNKRRLVWKEFRIGFVNGGILGLLSFAIIGGYLYVKGNVALFSFTISGCLGLAMVLAMMISSVTGTVIPMFFRKIGVDPAVASGPLITTVNDLVSVISYYGLVWILLINTMHIA